MEKPDTQASPEPSVLSASRGWENAPAVLWHCASDAFVEAILISVFGEVAVNVVGGVWKEMTPTPPPGFARQPLAEAAPAISWNVWSFVQQHRFAILFFAFFALNLWGRTVGTVQRAEEPLGRRRRIGKRLAENWFGLVVGNAFGALISAMVLSFLQQFSGWYWIRSWILDSLLAVGRELASSILGAGKATTLGGWFSWYGENQLKLTFWVFYLAAICDDLGIPNLKTFGRWSWRRLRKSARKRSCYG